MPLSFWDYIGSDIEVDENTVGGDTYTVDGKLLCFSYVRSHYRAVKALTDGKSKKYMEINDEVAWDLVDAGTVTIDDGKCDEDNGWLGCIVIDGDGTVDSIDLLQLMDMTQITLALVDVNFMVVEKYMIGYPGVCGKAGPANT